MPVDVLLVDDGSRDSTAAIGREHGARVVSHPSSEGLGAALRTGLAHARDEGYAAAVYLDGDGEYDPADFATVLEPVARGRADYVIGSRFLGDRDGMTWHRTLANRVTSSLVGLLAGTVASDAQSGYRAFSARALASARIRHDYNYAQVLTLSLWGARTSSRWRCRSPTAGAPAAARSCATRSTWRAWRRPSGASGGTRASTGGRPARRSRPRS